MPLIFKMDPEESGPLIFKMNTKKMGITFSKWTQAKMEASWSKSIDKVQAIVSVSRLHVVVQSVSVQVKYILIQIWTHQVTPKSVGSLTLKSRERLVHGVILIDVLCLVCWPGSCHRKIQKYKRFKRRKTHQRFKREEKHVKGSKECLLIRTQTRNLQL